MRGVEILTGRSIRSVRGTAAVAGVGDPKLLGDWIRAGTFEPNRLAARFKESLGGNWTVAASQKTPTIPDNGYWVTMNRDAGT